MEQLFGALPKILGRSDLDPVAHSAMVFAAWHRICGQLIKERTAVIDFTDLRLKVAVQDRTWQRHLEDMSPPMLAKLNTVLGDGSVRFIEFVIDGSAVDAAKGELTAEAHQPMAELDPQLRKAAEAIGDELLRESFLRTAAVYLDRQKRNNAAS
ncbi:MAG: DUF721 domain-containing protein [Pyrinomonadaceae bacterium]|nr:DUF721 domain-containing protein [Pyrinomonadaceae bacterium]